MENLSAVTSDKDIPTKSYIDTAVSGRVPSTRTVQGEALSADVTLVIQQTFTLSSSGWSNKSQTISDSLFVVNGYIYFVGPDPSSLVSYSLYGVYADDVTTAGSLTFHCQDTPSENLTVIVTRMVI